jgi:hypothetical protein
LSFTTGRTVCVEVDLFSQNSVDLAIVLLLFKSAQPA